MENETTEVEAVETVEEVIEDTELVTDEVVDDTTSDSDEGFSDYSEDELWNMSDEELEAAFNAAKEAESLSEEIDEDIVEDTEDDDTDDELEQPDTDSNETESDTDEDEVTDDVEEESQEPDEDTADDPDETEKDVAEETPEIAKYKVKANGTEMELTTEELLLLAPKALNYTQKMQAIKPWTKGISAFQENGFDPEDINIMIDLMKGDKDAIADLIKRHEIDTLDLDAENTQYSPNSYGKSEKALKLEEVVGEINQDEEFKITQYVVDSTWDSASRSELRNNPSIIKGLHADVKNGIFDKVNPISLKLKALDGGNKSDIEYYLEAGRQYFSELDARKAKEASEAKILEERKAEKAKAVKEAKTKVAKQEEVKKASKARKAAAPTKKVAGTKKVVDYLEDISEESFDSWYAELQAKQ